MEVSIHAPARGATDISQYLKSNSKNGNAFNQIEKIPIDDLLEYCAMDSLLEYRLAMIQMEQMEVVDLEY